MEQQKTVLKPCPTCPNCVSSLADPNDREHYVQALDAQNLASIEPLRDLVLSLPRVKLVEQSSTWLKFTATSRVFRFTDEIEFLLDQSAGLIHVRSASRVGYSDFGVNRKRVETIRTLWKGRGG